MAILVQSNKKPSVSYPEQTGSIVTFNSQYAGLPLKSCVVDFEGETGIDSLDFSATGKNFFDKDSVTLGKWLTNVDTELSSVTGSYSDYIPIVSNIPYYFSHIAGIGAFYSMCVYDENKTFLENINIEGGSDASGTVTFTQGAYIRVNVYQTNLDVCQIELGDTATSYESYNGNNKLFSFGKTIQNGSLNVLTGELTNNNTTPPEVINLGGMNIETLQGENNLFASTGETTVSFIKIGG
jgi:hypothetical protein